MSHACHRDKNHLIVGPLDSSHVSSGSTKLYSSADWMHQHKVLHIVRLLPEFDIEYRSLLRRRGAWNWTFKVLLLFCIPASVVGSNCVHFINWIARWQLLFSEINQLPIQCTLCVWHGLSLSLSPTQHCFFCDRTHTRDLLDPQKFSWGWFSKVPFLCATK